MRPNEDDFRALWEDLRADRIVRGASSIGEQVARILTPRPHTYWSHWLDGIDATRLIGRFGHGQVLEFYLNQVPYGAQRRGVAEPARYYFGAVIGSLDDAEQMALAVMVRSPGAYDPRRHAHALRRAVDALATRMWAQGEIEASQLRAGRDTRALRPRGPAS